RACLGVRVVRTLASTGGRAIRRSDRDPDRQRPQCRRDRRLAGGTQYLILLRQAIERGGLPLTATGNLSRAVVAEMCKLIEWPDYDQADAFRLNKVIN